MASAKALAAIALTLIIAVPIVLGYGLASEDREVDVWETESSYNVSDTLLNSTTPYTAAYMGPQNNSELLQNWIYPSQDVTEAHRVAPTYRSVSTTYSTIPEYTTNQVTTSLSSATVQTFDLTYSGSVVSVGTSGSSPTNTVSSRDQYSLTITSGGVIPLHWSFRTDTGSVSISDTSTSIYIFRDGTSTWTAIVNGDEIEGIAWWAVATDYSGTVTVTSRNYTALNYGSNYTFATSPTNTALKLTGTDGTYYTYTDSQQIVNVSGGEVIVGTETFTNITGVAVGFPGGTTSIYLSVPSTTGNYADPAQGWTIPTYTDRAYQTWWTNGHQNAAVDMMFNFTGDATVYITPSDGMIHTTTPAYTLSSASGIVTVNSQALGAYQFIEMVVTEDGATFYGINAWPAMTQSAFRLNSIEFENDWGMFTAIELYGSEFANLSFRVDSSQTIAGSFPSTKDFTLNMSGLFPNKSYTIKLNSIGIYGDNISIGSTSYEVTNGRITVGGETVALKGMTISSRSNGATYDLYIGDKMIGSTAAPASIYFGGEWSLTATADIIGIQTKTLHEWAPGEFAFDKDSFVGVIVLVAAAAFIGLGIHGARSGMKVGLLLLICGGAALIAMSTL